MQIIPASPGWQVVENDGTREGAAIFEIVAWLYRDDELVPMLASSDGPVAVPYEGPGEILEPRQALKWVPFASSPGGFFAPVVRTPKI